MTSSILVTTPKKATVVFKDATGAVVTPATPIAWAANPNGIVAISALDGSTITALSVKVTGVAGGNVTITATEPTSGVVGSLSVTVNTIETTITTASVELSDI